MIDLIKWVYWEATMKELSDEDAQCLLDEYNKRNEKEVKTIKETHKSTLRYFPSTVLNKRTQEEEAKFVIDFIESFNEIRGLYIGKKSNMNIPDAKACRQLVELFRNGITLDELFDVIHNAFQSDYHKENGYRHITPEFISRIDKFQKYS